MEPLDSGSIQLELKYCERCGDSACALKAQTWCSARLVPLPCLALTRVRALPIRYIRHPGPAVLSEPQTAFWSEGGNA